MIYKSFLRILANSASPLDLPDVFQIHGLCGLVAASLKQHGIIKVVRAGSH